MQASIRELLEDKLSIPAPTAVTAVVAVIALSATGWQVLHWYSSVNASPATDSHPAVVSGQTVDPLPVILSADVFGAAASPTATASTGPEVTREATGFVLRAAFAGENGGGGAIIENSAGQADWYTVGQNVVPGLVLKEVRADHVIFDRGGSIERLQFERLAEMAAAQAVATQTTTTEDGVATFTVEPGEPQPIPQDLAPEEKANLIRQRLEELRNRTRK